MINRKNSIPIILLLVLLLIAVVQSNAQEKYTVSGKISDALTGEYLVGATIYEKGTSAGTVTNTYGFYSLTLAKGSRDIQISYMGYTSISKVIILNKNTILSLKLAPSEIDLDEVVVFSTKKDQNVTSTDMGIERMEVKDLETIPVLLGEKDVLKTIQLLPGISAASEGSSGFTVRGGSIDQNLILLDEAPVYSASHLMGFFSVFNSDALKNMSVYKGEIRKG